MRELGLIKRSNFGFYLKTGYLSSAACALDHIHKNSVESARLLSRIPL
jgi:hypothetical protein